MEELDINSGMNLNSTSINQVNTVDENKNLVLSNELIKVELPP